jgi:hypothetical protein
MTFGKFAGVYKQRHVLAKGLALSSTVDYRLKPLIERFGEQPIAEIKTADIDDFVADLKQLRMVNGLDGRPRPSATTIRGWRRCRPRRALGGRQGVRSEDRSRGRSFKNHSRSHRTKLR